MKAIDIICRHIREQGPLPFVEFMHQALYAPNVGYYSSHLQKFGVEGDFVTAPELTPLFGYTLANQCQQVLHSLDSPIVFEFGAGSGQLCVDLLTQLEKLDNLPTEYHILEVSAHLQARQSVLIQEKIPHLAPRVQWVHHWPKNAFAGVVIANEVLDAMPVHRFLKTQDKILESYVTLNANEELNELMQPCKNARLIKHVQRVLTGVSLPYQSEVNLFIDDWLQQCYAMLSYGALLIIDYGYPQHEYYHPDRHHGTLMCHYRHQAHTNPFVHVGEQDITAHVDFTHVAEAADAAGFHVAGYTNQASFLLDNGLLSLLSSDEKDLTGQIKHQQGIKQLLLPSEMGELFKVMALTKNIHLDLQGFQGQDKRASL